MRELGKLSRILILFGSVYMLLYGISFFLDTLLLEKLFFQDAFWTTLNPTLTQNVLGNQGWLWSIFFTIVTGLISLYGHYDLKKNPAKLELNFIWGVFIIVLGVIGGTIGGVILIIAGLFLLINYQQYR